MLPLSRSTTRRLLGAMLLSLLACDMPAQDALAPFEAVISVADQRLALLRGGMLMAKYPVSTSKFGTGDTHGSYKTPLGRLRVCEKIGDGFASGAVLKGREATGEILPINAPGRDPIVTRILWLEGLEEQNRHAHARAIYIHGTPEEKNIGEPVSWGCVRMRSRDVIALFDALPVGADVTILPGKLPKYPKFDERRLPATLLVKDNGSAPQPPESSAAMPPSLLAKASAASPSRGTFSTTPRSKGAASEALSSSILLSGLSGITDSSESAPAQWR